MEPIVLSMVELENVELDCVILPQQLVVPPHFVLPKVLATGPNVTKLPVYVVSMPTILHVSMPMVLLETVEMEFVLFQPPQLVQLFVHPTTHVMKDTVILPENVKSELNSLVPCVLSTVNKVDAQALLPVKFPLPVMLLSALPKFVKSLAALTLLLVDVNTPLFHLETLAS